MPEDRLIVWIESSGINMGLSFLKEECCWKTFQFICDHKTHLWKLIEIDNAEINIGLKTASSRPFSPPLQSDNSMNKPASRRTRPKMTDGEKQDFHNPFSILSQIKLLYMDHLDLYNEFLDITTS